MKILFTTRICWKLIDMQGVVYSPCVKLAQHIIFAPVPVTAAFAPWLNTLRPRQNGRRFVDDTFKCISLKENVRISIKISLKFLPQGPINNNPALVQIMAWRRSGDKPLSEPMMVSLLTHICVARPQWVKIDLFFVYKNDNKLILQATSRRITWLPKALQYYWQKNYIT